MAQNRPKIYKRGSRGPDVVALQQQLNLAGLSGVPLPGPGESGSGQFGPRTEAKVLAFQKKYFTDRKEQDGKVGPNTRRKLREVVEKRTGQLLKPMSGKCTVGIPVGRFATALVVANWLPIPLNDESDDDALSQAMGLLERLGKETALKKSIQGGVEKAFAEASVRKTQPDHIIRNEAEGPVGVKENSGNPSVLDNPVIKAAVSGVGQVSAEYAEMCTAPGVFYDRHKNQLIIIAAGIGVLGLPALWDARSDEASGMIASMAKYNGQLTKFQIGEVKHSVDGNIALSKFEPSTQKLRVDVGLGLNSSIGRVVTRGFKMNGLVNAHKKETKVGGSFDYGFSFKNRSKYTLGLKVDAKLGAYYEYLPSSFEGTEPFEEESEKFELYGKMKIMTSGDLFWELEYRDSVLQRPPTEEHS